MSWRSGDAGRATRRLDCAAQLPWLALLAGSCSPAATPAEHAATPAPTPDAAARGATVVRPPVQLIERGSEPRRQLRYAVCQSCTERATLQLGGSFETHHLLVARPDEKSDFGSFGADLSVTVGPGQTPENFAYGLTFSGARSSAPNALAQLADINGAKIGVEANSLGKIESLQIDARSVLLQNLKEELSALLVPFPEQPVGPGATWLVAAERTTENGSVQPESRTYELESMDGDRLVVRAAVREIFDPNATRLPREDATTSGSGLKVTQDVLWSHGTRTSRICVDLRRVVPGKYSEIRRIFEQRIVSDGVAQRFDSIISATLELRPEGGGDTGPCSPTAPAIQPRLQEKP